MSICFSLASAPELLAYPAQVRQLILKRALASMRGKTRLAGCLPTILCFGGGMLGAIAALYIETFLLPLKTRPEQISSAFFYNPMVVSIGAFGGGFFGLQLELRKLRPYLRRAIEDYVSEITSPLTRRGIE